MNIHFALTFILCVLNLMPIKKNIRRKWVLPITFVAIGLFMGLRYDYGLDYWNYYDEFYNYREYRTHEFLFWIVFFAFNKYYQFILVKSLVLAALMFYMVRKYVPEKYYALFVLLFMTHGSMIYTMITAERTCMGAMVLWVGLEFFYFRKKNYILLCGSIIVAALFHSTLFGMFIIPLVDYLTKKRNFSTYMIFLVSALFLGMITRQLFGYVTEYEIFSNYAHYTESGRFQSSNFFGVIENAIPLITLYFMLSPFKYKNVDNHYAKLVVLSVCYYIILFSGFESDGRFGICLMPFVVIALIQRLQTLEQSLKKVIMIAPFLYITYVHSVNIYSRMIREPLLPGNYLTYKTIIDANFYE